MVIRPARDGGDWDAIRTLCCLTGAAGDPVEPARWPFFAEVWIGPYKQLRPEWTYVAERDGAVVGYLTGCPDTPAFVRIRRLRVTLPLLGRVLGGRYRRTADTRRFVRQALGLARPPEARVPAALRRRLHAEYPAHLHMNVGAGARRAGVGTALLARFLADLKRAGISGVHLLCGPDPVGFYARGGFTELAAIEADARVFLMGVRLRR
jgi:GNAT superfamily N-acetyltransferase